MSTERHRKTYARVAEAMRQSTPSSIVQLCPLVPGKRTRRRMLPRSRFAPTAATD